MTKLLFEIIFLSSLFFNLFSIQGFHLFMDLKFREVGKHVLRIEVLDGDQLALEPFEYPLIVNIIYIIYYLLLSFIQIKAGPVSEFSIVGDFSNPIPLGGFLPPFTIEFKDEYGQSTVSTNTIQVSLSSTGLKFSCNDDQNPEFQVNNINYFNFIFNIFFTYIQINK